MVAFWSAGARSSPPWSLAVQFLPGASGGGPALGWMPCVRGRGALTPGLGAGRVCEGKA